MHSSLIHPAGLTTEEVLDSRARHGENKVESVNENKVIRFLKKSIKEPMLVILIITATLYFIHRDFSEAIFLAASIFFISLISHFQESRSKKALDALNELTNSKSKVVRNGKYEQIREEEIVIDDILVLEEGTVIPADAIVLQANDFTVNESILTGESLPVEKDVEENNAVYKGTSILSGSAICRVLNIGSQTKIGLVGKSLITLKPEPSPLQIQIADFVKKMAAAGLIVFLIIWITNIYRTRLIIASLLNSLTLAMSILPEEIPVAFATFMALGARRLMQLGVIVKDTRTVETLGSATIICLDKTGTITKNEMTLAGIYVHDDRLCYEPTAGEKIQGVITTAMWASEPSPFDPMEKTLHEAYQKICSVDLRPDFTLFKEYALSGKPPFMTHAFKNSAGIMIVAAKGAPEAILRQSNLTPAEKQIVLHALESFTAKGYRVLGVGEASGIQVFPDNQQEITFSFKGLVAFYDPPKENIKDVLQNFYKAGIQVKIMTGDNLATSVTIGKEIGLKGAEQVITGEELLQLSDIDFARTIKTTSVFARMFPEAKLKVIEELKKHEIVAMTGDGVNDAPALKAANIGIAMGQKGSDVAKQASALILKYDDLAQMIDGIAMGRRIYNNLKKAIQYIISIHIPIIMIVFLPLILGWPYPVLFTPVHVIFLELIMGPTCSVIYENEPSEKNAMTKKPRHFTSTFFNVKELTISILQGLAITSALIFVYWYALNTGKNLQLTTSLVFISLITANVALTLVNRSFYFSVFSTIRYKNNLIPFIIGTTILLAGLMFVITPIRNFFLFQSPSVSDILTSMAAALFSITWFEVYKFIQRKKSDKLKK